MSILETFSSGDVASHALLGFLILWSQVVFVFLLTDTNVALLCHYFLVTEIMSCPFQILTVCFSL